MPKRPETIRQKNTGNVEVKITIGKNLDGSLIRKSFYGQSKKQALAKADKYKELLKDNIIESDVFFENWAHKWLETYKKDSVRSISYHNTYEQPLEKHIIPYFKNARLRDIKQVHIKEFFNAKADYSFSTLSNFKLIFNGIFETAIANDLLFKNPTKGVRLPKSSSDVVTEKRAYAYEQARVVIDFAKSHPYGADIITLLKTGLRRAELVALEWKNIDVKNKIIHITQSASESKGGVVFSPCKTKKSIRNIPFDDELLRVFNSIPRTKDFKTNKTTVINKFLISGRYGSYVSPHHWSKRRFAPFMSDFKQFCEDSGYDIPCLSPHELRHSFGSILYARGVDIVTISKLMGHANIEITVKLYVHDDLGIMQNAIEKGV